MLVTKEELWDISSAVDPDGEMTGELIQLAPFAWLELCAVINVYLRKLYLASLQVLFKVYMMWHLAFYNPDNKTAPNTMECRASSPCDETKAIILYPQRSPIWVFMSTTARGACYFTLACGYPVTSVLCTPYLVIYQVLRTSLRCIKPLPSLKLSSCSSSSTSLTSIHTTGETTETCDSLDTASSKQLNKTPKDALIIETLSLDSMRLSSSKLLHLSTISKPVSDRASQSNLSATVCQSRGRVQGMHSKLPTAQKEKTVKATKRAGFGWFTCCFAGSKVRDDQDCLD